jgi:hypothetical protein
VIETTMNKRAELDKMAWGIIDKRVPATGSPAGYAASGRPANFVELGIMAAELGDMSIAKSEFLHEFYRFKTPEFLAQPSPEYLPREEQALLAGIAEYLALRFGLPVPAWTQDPMYMLPELWDSCGEWYPGVALESRVASADPIFLKRNVIFASRGLIVL